MRRLSFTIFLLIFLMATAGAASLRGIYFTEKGCSHCDAFIYAGKARLEAALDLELQLDVHDILSSDGYELCARLLSEHDLAFTVYPVLFLEDRIYIGSTAIEDSLGPDLAQFLEQGSWPEQKVRATKRPSIALAVVPILFAGLLDGINPCAFSTLLFFLSFIGLRRKSQKEILSSGLAFILGVFITYFLIGLGLLGALRAFLSERRFSVYLDAVVAILALVLAALNIKDAIAAHQGRASESMLQLPGFLKQANHAGDTEVQQRPPHHRGIPFTGSLVSIIELACTGQIYLPTLAYMNSASFSSHSLGLLLVYNLAFISPLLTVFILFYSGFAHERLRSIYAQATLSWSACFLRPSSCCSPF
ncbi:hypothetical protein MASR2M78_17960 [Treponema sp.]